MLISVMLYQSFFDDPQPRAGMDVCVYGENDEVIEGKIWKVEDIVDENGSDVFIRCIVKIDDTAFVPRAISTDFPFNASLPPWANI